MSATFSEDMKLMYQPYSSILNPGFWQQMTNIKLNQLKLSQDPVDIHGSYSCNLSETLPCLASFEHSSFNQQTESGNKSSCRLYGQLICTNIMQEFLDYDKKKFLDNHGTVIWRSIFDGKALSDPGQCLSKFGLLVYADLKKYKFFYWFAFPVINYPRDVYLVRDGNSPSTSGEASNLATHRPILEIFSEKALRTLQEEYDKPDRQREFSRSYFIIKHYKVNSSAFEEVLVFPLTQYREAVESRYDETEGIIYFAYSDPSASQVYPGWPLRNYLCLIAVQFQLDRVKIVRIRKGQPTSKSKLELHHSRVLEVAYKLNPTYCVKSASQEILLETPLITGWEKNESQKVAPKQVNLSGLLDPKRLAEDAVNLNLRLMKWRLLPGLDLDKIANTKCLILGCGTLGCHVARGLLSWGIKEISIVDSSKISYSNPVRQTLYTFDDCVKPNGAFKAEVAAVSLKRIHPSVIVKSHIFSIPMPGHHLTEKEIDQAKMDVASLETLIEEHDAIFLLMDTRESRWLPTVIAMSKQKLVINAAIGFDTFLLQRYGIRDYSKLSTESSPSKANNVNSKDPELKSYSNQLPSDKLGCYFCNDIVAPGDSTLDRTLDQQCTVSRPGVSMMVSAMAVELLASVVSSQLGSLTPAPIEIQRDSDENCGSELGIVPHSIRGNLARYHIYMPTTPSFNKCSACSAAVIDAYRTSGFNFLLRVFDDPNHLEEVAGLKDLQNVSDNVWALDSDEDANDLEYTEEA